MTALKRLYIPGRIRFNTMLKEGEAFDVPDTPEGVEFLRWCESASATDLDQIMVKAADTRQTIVDAWLGHNEGDY